MNPEKPSLEITENLRDFDGKKRENQEKAQVTLLYSFPSGKLPL